MNPIVYRRKIRTGWRLGLILAVLLLGLLTEPGVRQAAGDRLSAFFSGGRLFRLLLYLETGGTARPRTAAPNEGAGPGASGSIREQASPSASGITEASDPGAPQKASAGSSASSGLPAGQPDSDRPDASTERAEGNVPEASGEGLMPEEPLASVGLDPAAQDESPEAAEPAPAGFGAGDRVPPFTAAEAEAIVLRGSCDYAVDKTELLQRPLCWNQEAGPRILIIHTHSSEAYTPSPGHSYSPDGDFRTLEPSESVIAVGDALTEALGELDVEVIHDRSCCDYPSYNKSYAVARGKIEAWLERYPSIQMVIDLHRDAMDPPVRETVEAAGEEVAALMLVIGTDEGGLSHPRWEDNLSCGLKLQALGNRAFPGLFKPISFRRERFNGDLTPGSLIVEVGSTGDTLPEAQAAMPALARILAQLLSTEQQKSGQP